MKTLNKTLIYIAMIAIAGTFFTSCRGQQPAAVAPPSPPIAAVTGAVEVQTPFESPEYRSDANHFRAVNQGTSIDYAMARRIAMQNARTELAAGIEATLRAVIDQYVDQRQVGNVQEFQTRMQEQSRTVVNQRLNDVRVLGTRTFRYPDNRLAVWVAIEMPREALVQNLNERLSQDDRLRLDFDQHLFQRIFDEEMRRFDQNR